MNKIFTVIGRRGSGKTPFVIGGDFEPGLASHYLKKGMSVLIIDEIDHARYRHVPLMLPKDYGKLSTHPGIYRTLAALQDMPALVNKIAMEKLVWNTLLVCEDSKKYISERFNKKEWALLGNSKQQNCDIVFMYWNWSITPKDLLKSSNHIVVMPTADGPVDKESSLGGCFADCMEAHQLVCAGTHPYLIVNTGI